MTQFEVIAPLPDPSPESSPDARLRATPGAVMGLRLAIRKREFVNGAAILLACSEATPHHPRDITLGVSHYEKIK